MNGFSFCRQNNFGSNKASEVIFLHGNYYISVDNDGIQVPEGYQTKMKCPFKPNSKVAKVYWITPQGDSISEDTLDMR